MPRRSDISPISRLLDRLDAVADGLAQADTVPTGFPSLDKMLGGGARRGDLILLTGDTGSGKSAFALAIALRVAEAGRRALFLTTEMEPERVLERVLAIEGRVRIDDLRGGKLDEGARAAVGAAAVRLRDWPLMIRRIGSKPDLSVVEQQIQEDAGHRGATGAGENGSQLVILDSVQGLVGDPSAIEGELAIAILRLKEMALDRGVPLLVVAHLPDADRARADQRPTLDDLGARGGPRHYADVILGLYREEQYRDDGGADGATELIVLKNRNGPTGYADLYFYKAWMRFEDMLDPDR
jgi:replicative DNA helicase